MSRFERARALQVAIDARRPVAEILEDARAVEAYLTGGEPEAKGDGLASVMPFKVENGVDRSEPQPPGEVSSSVLTVAPATEHATASVIAEIELDEPDKLDWTDPAPKPKPARKPRKAKAKAKRRAKADNGALPVVANGVDEVPTAPIAAPQAEAVSEAA